MNQNKHTRWETICPECDSSDCTYRLPTLTCHSCGYESDPFTMRMSEKDRSLDPFYNDDMHDPFAPTDDQLKCLERIGLKNKWEFPTKELDGPGAPSSIEELEEYCDSQTGTIPVARGLQNLVGILALLWVLAAGIWLLVMAVIV